VSVEKSDKVKGTNSSLDAGSDLTPDNLFKQFRRPQHDFGWRYGYTAIEEFKALKDKSTFIRPAMEFIQQEDQDGIRSWGTTILEITGGQEALRFLIDVIKIHTNGNKKKYINTRFFALKGIANLATSESEKKELLTMLQEMWNSKEEDYLAQGEAAILLALNEKASSAQKRDAEKMVRSMLSVDRIDEYWPALRVLRGLREFAFPAVVDDIILIIKKSRYYDHRRAAIIALGIHGNNLQVVRELGLIVRNNQDSALRLEAVESLARLRHPESQGDLIFALRDDNAEVRFRASKALKSLLNEEAVSTVIQFALRENVEETWLSYLIEALRLIDSDRIISTQILSKELSGDNQRRAKLAEQILLELGGWAAVQKISQRRTTLETLDKLLEQSEKTIKDTFSDTITQARRNFYFAMGVNIIIVIVGLFLISLSIMQLIKMPEKIETWIIPGAGGLFGILITMFFNNPRQNAREDLTALMNVNVIFLGFLRRLNQIDATFKHAFIESLSFGTHDMDQTLKQIDGAVVQTLKMADEYLRSQKGSQIKI
jgi:HEAT repeat protein